MTKLECYVKWFELLAEVSRSVVYLALLYFIVDMIIYGDYTIKLCGGSCY